MLLTLLPVWQPTLRPVCDCSGPQSPGPALLLPAAFRYLPDSLGPIAAEVVELVRQKWYLLAPEGKLSGALQTCTAH